jgi:hypothetical protein
MNDWQEFLGKQLTMLNKEILIGKGSVSHAKAVEKAEREFDLYREREMKQLESDFDRAVRQLTINATNSEEK